MQSSETSPDETYLGIARDAHGVLLHVFQLLESRTHGRVVVRFERVVLDVDAEGRNVDAVADVIVAVLVRVYAEGDGEPVLGAMGTHVRDLSVRLLDLGTFEVARHVVDELDLLVLRARVVLGAGSVVPAQVAMLVRGLEVVERQAAGIAAVLEPLLVDLVHASLAVRLVLLVAVVLPLEHDGEVLLDLEHVLAVVRLAPLPPGAVRLFGRAVVVVGVEGIAVPRRAAAPVVVVLELASTIPGAGVHAVLLRPDGALGRARRLARVLVAAVGRYGRGALVRAAAVGLLLDETHAGVLGAQAEDGEVLGREDGGGVLLRGELVVELLHLRAPVVGRRVLRHVEAELVLPRAVRGEPIVGPVGVGVVLVVALVVVVVLELASPLAASAATRGLGHDALLHDLLPECGGRPRVAVHLPLEVGLVQFAADVLPRLVHGAEEVGLRGGLLGGSLLGGGGAIVREEQHEGSGRDRVGQHLEYNGIIYRGVVGGGSTTDILFGNNEEERT